MILNKVKEIMMENLSIEEESITLESTFESLEIDSLDVFQLVMEVEEAFGIQIENPENMKTIKDLVNYIEEKCLIYRRIYEIFKNKSITEYKISYIPRRYGMDCRCLFGSSSK